MIKDYDLIKQLLQSVLPELEELNLECKGFGVNLVFVKAPMNLNLILKNFTIIISSFPKKKTKIYQKNSVILKKYIFLPSYILAR